MDETNNLEKLIENLPFFLQEQLNNHSEKDKLIEIVLDLGRRPEARFLDRTEYLSQKIISWQDIDSVTKQISKFSNENRAGIERTLHRISCIRNRQFLINGLTCRIGRTLFGTISIIRDLLESEKSLLILGKPGVGKTSIIREIARVVSDELKKRVIIIDTSNEIAGDSDIPHFCIGRARRMQVNKDKYQHQVMIEAVENHMPQVIIIDEIGTELEVLAAQTIAEKGVQLVGTTHGNCLKNLIKNPLLVELIGGIQSVTLSDEEAKRRGTQKSILERKTYPTFEIILELNAQNSWTIHENVKNSIDLFLKNHFILVQIRQLYFLEKIKIKTNKLNRQTTSLLSFQSNLTSSSVLLRQNWISLNHSKDRELVKLKFKNWVIYPYSLSNNLVKEVFLKLNLKFLLTNDIRRASLIIGSKKHIQQNFKLTKLANQKNIPIYSFQQLSFYQVSKLIQFLSSEKFQ